MRPLLVDSVVIHAMCTHNGMTGFCKLPLNSRDLHTVQCTPMTGLCTTCTTECKGPALNQEVVKQIMQYMCQSRGSQCTIFIDLKSGEKINNPSAHCLSYGIK